MILDSEDHNGRTLLSWVGCLDVVKVLLAIGKVVPDMRVGYLQNYLMQRGNGIGEVKMYMYSMLYGTLCREWRKKTHRHHAGIDLIDLVH